MWHLLIGTEAMDRGMLQATKAVTAFVARRLAHIRRGAADARPRGDRGLGIALVVLMMAALAAHGRSGKAVAVLAARWALERLSQRYPLRRRR